MTFATTLPEPNDDARSLLAKLLDYEGGTPLATDDARALLGKLLDLIQ